MNNIVQILKYKLKYEKCILKNLVIITIITLFFSLMKIADFSLVIIAESILLLMIIILFFDVLVSVNKSLNKEHGRVLFLAPIKGKEFLLASILEFIIYIIMYGVVFGISELIGYFIGGKNNLGLAIYSELAIMLLMNFILILAIIIFIKSYINNSKLRALGLFAGLIGWAVINNLIVWISGILPYVYLRINDFEIDLLENLFIIIALVIISYFAVRTFDKKIEIN